MAPRSGSAYAFTGSTDTCGPNEAAERQQLGRRALRAKAGQTVLNVTGQMEAQLAAGWRGPGAGGRLGEAGLAESCEGVGVP